MTPRDEQPRDYEDSYPYARQLIVESLPKSTMIVGGILWTVLFALQCWHLTETLSIRKEQGEQATDIAVMSTKADGYNRDMDALKGQVKTIDDRLRAMEERQLRVTR